MKETIKYQQKSNICLMFYLTYSTLCYIIMKSKHLFVRQGEDFTMDYKKMIIDMVEKIENKKVLEIIYDFVIVPYNKENSKRNGKRGN